MKLFDNKIGDLSIKLKVCGVSRQEDIEACSDLGVDAVGFLLGNRITNETSDKLTAEEAKNLIQKVPPSLASVVLVKEVEYKKIEEIIKVTRANALQLQNPELTIYTTNCIKAAYPSVELIRTIRIKEETEIIQTHEYIKALRGSVDAFLLDAEKGGSGKLIDWNIAKELASRCRELSLPIILAGGLNPQNLTRALETVNPNMVDIMSGVSKQPGVKDLDKIKMVLKILKSFHCN